MIGRIRNCGIVLVGVCCSLAIAAQNPPKPKTKTSQSKRAIDLLKARAGFQTKLVPNSFEPSGPADMPPADTFSLVRYPSPAGNLAAYVTPDPGDGTKHPALVWAKGGFGGIGDFLWDDAGEQHPGAFRQAGLVVMCPSWRGENDNPGKFELFYGEVVDAVAAIDYVSKLPYVDPSRVYMAGHSTGGTITLLTAEATDKLRAAFSFGGAPDIANVVRDGVGYGNTPFDPLSDKECRLRSAIHFVSAIRAPTFYFEGSKDRGYIPDAMQMQQRAQEEGAPFFVRIVNGGDHFNILRPITALVAEKILADTGPQCNIAIGLEEVRQAFARAKEK